MKKILLVEDDLTTATGIEYSLKNEGFEVITAHNFDKARSLVTEEDYDLALLDLNLPDGSGYDLCKQIRERSAVPIIFLTAVDDEINIVMGLDLGADDYVTKPFRLRELISRIKAALRRYQSDAADTIAIKDIAIESAKGKVYKGKHELLLTALEYKLLLTFFTNKDKIFTRDNLLASIWDVAGNYVNDNTLTVYIKRLREKIEDDPQKPQIIVTVRGMGYRVGN